MEPVHHLEMMTRAASMYYMDNITQGGIAEQLGVSRATVARLLQRAREEGIVEIRVNTHPNLSLSLEQALRSQFGLQHVHLVTDFADETQQRAAVGRAAAELLRRSVHDGMIVAMGMGRNTGAICQHILHGQTPVSATFVSANGGLSAGGMPINPNDICRCLADRTGGDAMPLIAPAFADSAEMKTLLTGHDQIQSALDTARQADLAFIGAGDVHERSVDVAIGVLPPSDLHRLEHNQAVGYIMGTFYNIDGHILADELQDRVIALSTDDLRRIPAVIAVASEPTKAAALLGGLRTGLLNGLITTIHNARHILALSEQHPAADY